jgi:hypothetical protein
VLLTDVELEDLVVEVATTRFGAEEFGRSQLLLLVEARIREVGAWTAADDKVPWSGGLNSEGLAAIDWAFTGLSLAGRLMNIGQDRWRIPFGRS